LKLIECISCKSVDFVKSNGAIRCIYCRSKYVGETNSVNTLFNNPPLNSVFEIDVDIIHLLEKIKEEPWNKKRYANLILDIDSTNEEALNILRGVE